MLLFSFSGCSDDNEESVMPVTLPVNYANLHGTWELAEWNGQPTPDGTYCYIIFDRKEHTFSMYQKFDSMYARLITGTFVLEQETEGNDMRTLISGTYDYGMGPWNQTYMVTDLLETGSMVWTAVDNEGDVCLYRRCTEVPQEVMQEAQLP